ncbi:MAG: caspase family protein [Rhodocyclaceae bacterium]|nr:caspase family protein [Rhodocyclaceae bacterium]
MPAAKSARTQFRLPFFTALTLLLSACATPPQYSKADDPFKALSSRAARQYAAAKMCLMLTENTTKAFNHLGEMHTLGTQWGAQSAEVDPKARVTELTEMLTSRFRETVKINSLGELQEQKCQLALALDIQITLRQVSFAEHTVNFAGTLVDGSGAPLDQLASAGKSAVPFPAFSMNFLPAWNQAVSSFGDSLDKSTPVANLVAGLPALVASTQAMASPTVAPASIDLAFWDSVKASTNPADFQAYLHKFPNGSFESLARSRLAALGEAAPARMKPLAQPTNTKLNFGNYHALVIGIDKYRSVTPLKTAVHDARTVADLLQKEYGFKVTLLVDPTRNQMLDSFDDLRRRLTDADNLLIYYAGHGYLDVDSDRGFWLPVDADANRRANWLSNSDIADMVRGTRAKHVLLVADSCYAGTLTRSLSMQMNALDDFTRLAHKKARTALVSGGLEPVEDAGGGSHSVFAKAFLDALWANTGIVDMSQIFSSMRRQVVLSAQQTPQYSDIRQVGHEGGDFIFVRKK